MIASWLVNCTNPKPLHSPLSRSLTNLTDTIGPNWRKYNLTSSSSACLARLPTKTDSLGTKDSLSLARDTFKCLLANCKPFRWETAFLAHEISSNTTKATQWFTASLNLPLLAATPLDIFELVAAKKLRKRILLTLPANRENKLFRVISSKARKNKGIYSQSPHLGLNMSSTAKTPNIFQQVYPSFAKNVKFQTSWRKFLNFEFSTKRTNEEKRIWCIQIMNIRENHENSEDEKTRAWKFREHSYRLESLIGSFKRHSVRKVLTYFPVTRKFANSRSSCFNEKRFTSWNFLSHFQYRLFFNSYWSGFGTRNFIWRKNKRL